MSHAELCLQEHILLDERAASIKSRSRSKSQSQPADSTAKHTADYIDGDKKSETSSYRRDSSTSFMDDPAQTVDSTVDETESSSGNSPTTPEETASAIADEQALKDIDQLLVKRVLQLAVELETQARVLLMHTMQKGSRPEVLLRADMVGRILFGAAPLLNSAYFPPCSGFRIGKSRNYI